MRPLRRIHTVPEDTLGEFTFDRFELSCLIGHITDPNDFIFPRIATRTGLKFQATVPAAPDPTPIPGMKAG